MIEHSEAPLARLVWSVQALLHAVSDALAARFSACTVRGEISNYLRAASGHCYFSLKDADAAEAVLRCVLFRRAAGLIDFNPANGQLVELRGRLAMYEPRGDLHFVVESMRLAGDGALYERYLQLKARLQAAGLFDAQRKRPLPAFARRVGVVTSLGAAALQDVLSTLARRAPHVQVIVYPSLVQGAQAGAALVQALTLATQRAEVDVLIVCRGGGSLQDLWAFNEEPVVRAIAACGMPVVCGVGHETDMTLADFAADVRAPTPTAAAELAAPTQRACEDALGALAAALAQRLHQRLDGHAQRLDRAALRLARPADGVYRLVHRWAWLRQRLSAVLHQVRRHAAQQDGARGQRLQRALRVALQRDQQRLLSLHNRLQGLDPHRVLARGYAWLADAQGHAVSSVAGVSPGAEVTAVLHDGQISATVSGVSPRRAPSS